MLFTVFLQFSLGGRLLLAEPAHGQCDSSTPLIDRKSTRLNSSHPSISYAVFCLKKKITRPHGAAAHCGAILAHDPTVMGPARGPKIARARARVRLDLYRACAMRTAERMRVDVCA